MVPMRSPSALLLLSLVSSSLLLSASLTSAFVYPTSWSAAAANNPAVASSFTIPQERGSSGAGVFQSRNVMSRKCQNLPRVLRSQLCDGAGGGGPEVAALEQRKIPFGSHPTFRMDPLVGSSSWLNLPNQPPTIVTGPGSYRSSNAARSQRNIFLQRRSADANAEAEPGGGGGEGRATIQELLRKLRQSGQLYHRQVKEVLPMVRLRRSDSASLVEGGSNSQGKGNQDLVKRQNILKVLRL